MTLKKLMPLVLLAVACAMPAKAVTYTFQDDFNDGVRDNNRWFKPDWSVGSLKELDTHLLFYSKSTNSFTEMPGLIANFQPKVNNGDTFDLSATVRVPHKIPSDSGFTMGNTFELGVGLFLSRTNSDLLEFTVRDTISNRQFAVYYMSQSLGSVQDYWTYPAPTNVTAFKLRMSYSCKTDKINFFWAERNSATWTKARGAITLADFFGAASKRFLTPYAIGYMDNISVPRGENIWLDDFIAVYNDLPL